MYNQNKGYSNNSYARFSQRKSFVRLLTNIKQNTFKNIKYFETSYRQEQKQRKQCDIILKKLSRDGFTLTSIFLQQHSAEHT